ncbi:MAG: class I tRNA ligase family protein, partial [Betaproteobacteria bacterium]|nr:class I tRNA ligase family protein [Betaproteobacteria bacterium]
VDDEKMSKSLGNFFTIREILEKFDAEVVRFFILRAHYRSPLNYSDQHLADAKAALTRLYTALRGLDVPQATVDWNETHAVRFKAAMDDDFNTPEALAVLFDLAGEVNKSRNTTQAGLLKTLAGVLGLLQRDPTSFFQGRQATIVSPAAPGHIVIQGYAATGTKGLSDEHIEELINERLAARKNKDFKRSDAIRDELKAAGIVLEDSPQGTLWRRG